MIVIADTSPINYLILIDAIDVLPKMFGELTIPRAVFTELQHEKASASIRDFTMRCPGWLKIVSVQVPSGTGLEKLDYGEQEAIYLAEQVKADLLLIDERKGFKAAKDRNLRPIGTLFVLEQAAEMGLIDLADSFVKLEQTNFYVSPILLQEILERNSLNKNR